MVKVNASNYINQYKLFIPKATTFFEEMLAPLFVTEWGIRASYFALIAFGILFFYTLITTFISWDKDFFITRMHAASVDNSSNEMLASIQKIPAAHLFGDAIASDGFVPITSLQLHLVGIISSTQLNQSRVIISEAGAPGKVYAVGDNLPSGIRVYAINRDGVIFDNDGHLEKLPLARSRLNFASMPKSLWSQNAADD